MKRLAAFMMALVLAGVLTACGQGSGNGGGKTGTFTAQRSDAYVQGDGNGFRDTLTVTYQDGKITDATFESIYAEGSMFPVDTKKSELSASEYPMSNPSIAEWMPELDRQIKESGKVDGVAGATVASDSAKLMLEAIEQATDPSVTIEVP